MKSSEQINELAESLSKAQGEFPTIPKNSIGHGYKYADLNDIIKIIKPILAKYDLAIMQSISGKHCITTRLMHKSGQYIEDTLEVDGLSMNNRMNATQAQGASITYGRRYALSAFLNLAVDEDTDGIAPQTNSHDPTYRPEIEIVTESLRTLIKNVHDESERNTWTELIKCHINNVDELKKIERELKNY